MSPRDILPERYHSIIQAYFIAMISNYLTSLLLHIERLWLAFLDPTPFLYRTWYSPRKMHSQICTDQQHYLYIYIEVPRNAKTQGLSPPARILRHMSVYISPAYRSRVPITIEAS